MSEWTSCTVQDLVDRGEAEVKTGPFGTQLHASDYVESGIPVINVRNIGFGDIRPEKLEYISEMTAQRLSSHLLKTKDIVFGRKGAVERHVFIKNGQDRWFQGSDCLRLRFTGGNVDSRYFSYRFLSEDHKTWMMNQCSHGATMASLNQDIVKRIPLLVPPLETQHKIASILSAYDDLIENNSRRIKVLEEMARMIYREWFVNFSFPGHKKVKMADVPVGTHCNASLQRIPEGWGVRTLKEFGAIVTGKTPSTKILENFGSYMPFIKTPDMHGNMFCIGTGEALSELGVACQKNKTIPPDSLCVSCIGTAGIVTITSTHAQTNQQINSIVLNDLSVREFLYFALLDLREVINQYGANGATMVNLNKGKFEALEVICPDNDTMKTFHKLVHSHFEEIKVLQKKNQNLRQTRDLLLPKLISGEVEI